MESKHQHLPPGTAKLGMTLFLMALGVLFAASMVGYLVVRLRAPAWPPPGSPRLPEGLWISTFILLTSSLTMHLALRSARSLPAARGKSVMTGGPSPLSEVPRPGTGRLSLWLWSTLILGGAFLVSQILNWNHLLTDHRLSAHGNLYAFTFYMLTGLHGAHVMGGLIPLLVTSIRSGCGRYHHESHDGVLFMSMYWHFLGVVWLAMFAVMVLAA